MGDAENKKYKVEIKKLPKSEVEIGGEIAASLLSEARKKAIKKFSEKLDLPGFRKGHVPENIVLEKISEREILEEAANILLNEFYPKIILDEKLDAIGRPKVSITKLALGNPLEFTVITAVLPEFELPEYKKIAQSVKPSFVESDSTTAGEEEIDDVVAEIEKNKMKHNFQDPNELRAKIKENIIAEKKFREVEKKRVAMIDAILEKTDIELPEILIESEIEKSIAQMKDEITRAGLKIEDYLKEVKKTEEEIRKDLRLGSEKRAKIQLLFNKIAIAEKLEPNKEILEHEVKHILEHYPEAKEENARIYVATQLLNQEVLKLLERN
ncbi:MAG: trigger factor [Patescibacteria group bacterium]